MIKDIYSKKRLASNWFNLLQQTICYEFEKIEHDLGKITGQKPKYFEKNTSTFVTYKLNLTYSEALLKTKTKQLGH